MIKWTITFDTYDGETLTEDFYFNLNKAELIQMQFDVNGAYGAFIERISNERDLKRLGEEFRKIILMSYGKKSDDGRLFRKSQEMRDDFEQSEAYASLYMELLTDSDKAVKFVRGILPKDLQGAPVPENLRIQN
jgi:hypothetical protein